MVRSTIKDKDYFDEYIEFEIETVEDYVETIAGTKGDDKKIERLQRGIFRAEIHALVAMYSRGDEIEEVEKFYLELMSKYFDFCEHPGFYMQIIWLLSIGVLLDVDKKHLQAIDEFVKTNNLQDKLCDLLLSAINSKEEWSSKFEFDKPYKFLEGIEDQSPKDAAGKLNDFVIKKWYKGMKDTYWYDSHKSDEDIYFGYWCFEAAALAKLFNIDDAKLKDSKYYPYDLAHYND